jgi:hypothetical protein
VSIPLGERYRHHGFKPALAFFVPGEGKDKAFWREDFSKYAAVPEILAGFG